MGQIIGGAAKPKRCNQNKLSQLGTPAAGEHILVSSDNSMNAAGQGNFDCYIVGNGRDAATALPLQYLEGKTLDFSEGRILYNIASTIPASNSRKILTNVPTISEEMDGSILLKGLNGQVLFTNTSNYAQYACYHVEDGKILGGIKIPANCNCIYVYSEGRQHVSSNVNFTLTIVYGTIRENLDCLYGKFSGFTRYSVWLSRCDVIANGTKERLLLNLPLLTSPDKKMMVLKGLDAKIRLRDSSNFILDEFIIYDGIEQEVVIPTGVTRIDVHTADDANVSADTLFEVQIFSGRIESDLNTNKVLFFEKKYIPANNYRNTSIRLDTVAKPVKAKVKLLGFNGNITFCNSSWEKTATYDLQKGVETDITLPSASPYIITRKNPQETVSEATYFSLRIIYSPNEEAMEIKHDDIFDDEKYVPVLQSMNLTAIENGVPSTNYKTLVLASITDIHNEPDGARKILGFINKYSNYFTDAIGLGDYQDGALDTPITIDSIDGWRNIIKTIGNHDAYTGWNGQSPTGLATEQVCYDTFIKDDVALWNVHYTANHCYLYKDYAEQKVRVVFLDYMHWTTEQETWFTQTLNETLDLNSSAYGYHVIVCQHMISLTNGSGNFVPFDNCSFECYDKALTGFETLTIPDIVHNFQLNGGKFICHLCGHTHRAYTGTYENYQDQVIIIQPCSAAFVYHRDSVFTWDTDYLMQFYVYSFDTMKQFIRVYKVGANFNRNLQHQESMLIQYGDNPKLLYSGG